MGFLFYYEQEKKDRSKSRPISKLVMYLKKEDNFICFNSYYDFDYDRYGGLRNIKFEHEFILNIETGDINVKYILRNNNLSDEKMIKSTKEEKKNDFRKLFNLIENGFHKGEKRNNYWGVKFERAKIDLENIFINEIKSSFSSQFFKEKDYRAKYAVYPLYDLLVDLHLEKKKIKGHDSVYFDIQNEYPKKKWLEKNENKFLPAVLDHYGIKSKYLIKELNLISEKPIYINSLNYLCKLFGDNYLDFLRNIDWQNHCFDTPPNKRFHTLKNDSEKKFMVSVINNWEKQLIRSDSIIYTINKLLSVRDLLEQKGMELKFKAKNDNEFENLSETWYGYRQHLTRGYKVRYTIDEQVISDIEQVIEIGDLSFKPKVLLSEEDFRIEGMSMKNCMAKQFSHGAIYLFISMQHKRKKINLQYRKGMLIQSYGKANTKVTDIFLQPTEILNDRLKKYHNLEWGKEKYDFVNSSLSIH